MLLGRCAHFCTASTSHHNVACRQGWLNPVRTVAQAIDLPSRSISVVGSDGSQESISYDLLVGADGSNSAVRSAVSEAVRYAHAS